MHRRSEEMMAETRTTESGDAARRTLRRRGLVAGAAALIAGVAAKRAAGDTPVAANDTYWSMPYIASVYDTATLFTIVNNSTGKAISATANSGDTITALSLGGIGVNA